MFMKTGDAEEIIHVVKNDTDDDKRENVLAAALAQAKEYVSKKSNDNVLTEK